MSVEPKPAELAEEVKAHYSQKIKAWIESRKDRDEYLFAKDSNDPRLTRVDQITGQLAEMLPDKAKILDLGFGPEGRDMIDLKQADRNFQVFGAELVFANVQNALKNPNLQRAGLQGKLVQADIAAGTPFKRDGFDAIILSSVIQHLTPDEFYKVVFPRIHELLKPGGLIQLIFKRSDEKTELTTHVDKTMSGVERHFYLYNAGDVVRQAKTMGFSLVESDDEHFGEILTWVDQNRPIGYAGMYLRKE